MAGGPLLSQPAVRPLTGKAANGGNGAGVAFLAEVTDDVELRRLEVRRYLEQNLIDCDAMVMVYADNAGWARAQLRAFLKATPRRERPVWAIPVIDAPAESKPELGFHLPEMVIIDGRSGIGSEVVSRLSEALRL